MDNGVFIKGLYISSPFYFAPINTGLVHNGNPTKELISFHKQRSNKYTGINYVGNIATSNNDVTNKNTLFINGCMENYRTLAREIAHSGSLPGAQIASYKSKFTPNVKFKNGNHDIYKEIVRSEIKNLTRVNIREIIDDFARSIRLLKNLGYKVIQIHAAHGYLLNSFISESFNFREDEYGSDRFLILKDIFESISDISGSIIIDVRISLFEDSFEDELNDKNIEFLSRLSDIPDIDIISISNGIYNIDKALIYPNKSKGNNFMIDILRSFIKQKPNKIWNLSGNIRDLNDLPLFQKNISYSIARPILADNNFLINYFENYDNIKHCTYCNKCHYYSRGKDFIECSINKFLF